ncbi:MAG: CRISPR-associated endonuclease Cas2 [Candidatus Yonathbacteria bacterium]|nr:CRISPR-associated endonuclease Cas2 [Candidatus Yonathbacteria bacterium]
MAEKFKNSSAHSGKRKSSLQKKILLLLYGGISLGLTRNPRQYFRIAQEMHREWKSIERDSLNRAIRSLYESKLVSTKDNHDGTLTLVLSKEGKRLALTYDIENIELKTPTQWDGRWRIVMFDVPEKYKRTRDALRMHLKNMGFYEFQKSVFVHPYPCAKEIEYITEFYQARRFVRFIVAAEIDNALELKRHFHLV